MEESSAFFGDDAKSVSSESNWKSICVVGAFVGSEKCFKFFFRIEV